MRNIKRENMLGLLPQGLGFVTNPNDPLNVILSSAARMLHKSEIILDKSLDNAFINRLDPTTPTKTYYSTVSFFDNLTLVFDFEILIDSILTGTAQIVDDEKEFLDSKITGVGRAATSVPDEIINLTSIMGTDTISGLSYGFDWTTPYWYLSKAGSTIIYTYDDDFTTLVNSLNVALKSQDYDSTSSDEYTNFTTQTVSYVENWDLSAIKIVTLPGFIQGNGVTITTTLDAWEVTVPNSYYTIEPALNGTTIITFSPLPPYDRIAELKIAYTYRVAELEYAPVGDTVLMDILDIDEETTSGTELTRTIDVGGSLVIEDYIVYTTKVFLNNENEYKSRYIIEYNHNEDNTPVYLTQQYRRHYLGLKGTPLYKLETSEITG